MNTQRFIDWAVPFLLLAAVTCAAWVVRSVLTLTNFITIYLLVVLVLAIRSGTRVALVGAFISFLSINFFLIAPYYTFLIADPLEVIDLVIFLVTAVLVGQLAASARYRERTSQQFEEADRLKTALLRAVSHDLRTPITIIKTSAANLRRLGDGLSQTERLELSQAIEAEADHLDRLIGNLLDLSRLEAGALTLDSQPNSLEEVAGDVAAQAFQRTGEERIALTFPEDLPLVRFDYGLIRQALTNLVDNSLRYEPYDSRVELRGEVSTGQARLRVINHGPNLTADDRVHMLEPFYRGTGGHIGLGLPIANGIVAAHHGQLLVEDTPGGGATFVIHLPVDNQEKEESHDAQRTRRR
ncbi:MAG: DUF4118 domain-containing protein [Chloroflexi bacterium]|nr:DUF4118 domain-containing protein [Chloroflexota bacterium]